MKMWAGIVDDKLAFNWPPQEESALDYGSCAIFKTKAEAHRSYEVVVPVTVTWTTPKRGKKAKS